VQGAIGVLHKPYEPEDLLELVERALLEREAQR
jgi:hypothetical protein